MKLRLVHRLFLAFAGLAIAAVFALFVMQQRSFRQDFLEYSDRQITERIKLAADRIGRRYAELGHWDFIARRPQVFNAYLDGEEPRGPGGGRGPPDGESRPLPRMQPPPDDELGPRRSPEKSPPPKQLDALNYKSRIALWTVEGEHLIGNPAVPKGSQPRAVMADGRTVGYLYFAPATAVSSEADAAFIAQQARHALWAGAVVVLFALGAAWFMARWLKRPVDALARGADRLAAGDFASRIESTRGDELGDLARDFNRLAEALAANQLARRRWGADIAHELRTPLAILRGEIQAMQDGVRPLNQNGLASLQGECDRLSRLVEDLYQLSLADAGALEYRFEPADLAALLAEVCEENRARMAAAGLALRLDPTPHPMPIRADVRRMVQLFANLLTNSMRYTDTPGQVVLRCERNAKGWRVEISDTPPGVPPEALPRLFERLYRVESSRHRGQHGAEHGAGLGLSIAKSIIEAHGGTIEALPSALGGLTIALTFPNVNAQRP